MSALTLRRRSDATLAVVDVTVGVAASYLAYRLRFEGDLPLTAHYVTVYRIAGAVAAVLWPLAGRISGLYRRGALRPGTGNLEPAFEAAIVVAVLISLVDVAALHGDVSRAWIGLLALFLIIGGVGSRALLRRVRRALVPLGVALERYAVVGSGTAARRLHGDLTRAPGAPFRVVATLPSGVSTDELVAEVRRLRLDGLVVPPEELPTDDVVQRELAGRLAGLGADLLVAPSLADLNLRVASIAMLHGVPLLRVAGLVPRRRAVRRGPRGRLARGVAVLGTRGIPANYGGFETFAERLALHLVGQGIPTTVYCRRHYATASSPWRGVRLVTLPTIRSKYLDTVVHTFVSALHLVATRGPRDVVLCNAANAPVVPFLRLCGRRVVLNVDGLEWRRSKWGVAGRAWYRMGEWLSVRTASVLVTDASEVQTYYRVRHDSDSVMIPYGADLLDRCTHEVPPEVDARRDGYVLYVSRWERENNPVLVARAHARAVAAGADVGLVMLGQATYDEQLEADVRAAADPRAQLPGAIFGTGYAGLQANARCYVHATEVGGTHPALIEAMGAGNLVLVLDTPENREVATPAALFFADEDELVDLIVRVARMSPTELEECRARSRALAAERYSWDAVGRAYLELLGGRASGE